MGGSKVSLPGALIESEFPYNLNDNYNGGYGSSFCDLSTHEAAGRTIIRPKTNTSTLTVYQYRYTGATHAERIN